ncbi:alpha/beta hydrolase [Oceanibaculum pacificum]|uniref:Alpha/beta hydrolase n=1 Tax=Oceanibaculum pacificum TaxID=580166 RepID=A0A154W4L8_9PROT|nr:alpha/beta hydrolase [Oceanibaculum pacificum]KZD08399.1 alpha/beta hydrolase [Oceanibaculum pacificum]
MFDGFEEARARVPDAEIHYRIGGSGPPLLLLHGYPQTHHIWHKVAPMLAERFTLVMPDLRGYGRSRGPAPDAAHLHYSKRAMAADMVALMSGLGFKRFGLAGHDRGGRVGYRLCLDHPQRVTRFCPIDIIPTLDAWERMDADKAISTYHWQFLAVPAPVPEKLIGADPDFYYSHLLDRWAGYRDRLAPEAVADYLTQFHDPAVIAATCADYRAGASVDRRHDAEDRAAGRGIVCPVLVLWGRGYLASKAASPSAIWRDWATEVSEVALDCGHFVVEEEPEKAAAALGEFFA